MTSNSKVLTPTQAKERLSMQGKTLKDFAIENGFEPSDVYRVINGSRKGRYGTGHKIAVALGLKPNPEATV